MPQLKACGTQVGIGTRARALCTSPNGRSWAYRGEVSEFAQVSS